MVKDLPLDAFKIADVVNPTQTLKEWERQVYDLTEDGWEVEEGDPFLSVSRHPHLPHAQTPWQHH